MVRAKVFAGYQTTAGLSTEGAIYMNGANYDCQQNIPWDNEPHGTSAIGGGYVDMVFSEGQHGLAIDAGGQVWHWGENFDGQAGNGQYTGDFSIPGFTAVPVPPSKLVAAGDYSCACVTINNEIYVWGYGDEIPLRKTNTSGSISPDPAYTPIFLISFNSHPDTEIIDLDISGVNGGFVDSNGKLWVWGGNMWDEAFLRPDNTFYDVGQHPTATDVAGVCMGYDNCAYWTNTGDVYAWGLGYGAFPTAVNISLPESIVQVVCEWGYYFALGQSGAIYSWSSGATSGSNTGLPASTYIDYNYGDEKFVYLQMSGSVGYTTVYDPYWGDTSSMYLGGMSMPTIDFGMPDFSGWGSDWNTDFGQNYGYPNEQYQRLLISRSSVASIAFKPKNAGSLIGKSVNSKVSIYSNPAGTDLISVMDSAKEPDKFQYTSDGTKWINVTGSGIPIVSGSESIKVVLSSGPRQRVFVKVEFY